MYQSSLRRTHLPRAGKPSRGGSDRAGLRPLGADALGLVQVLLADPDRLRSDLKVLVVAQPLDRLFEAEDARRLQTYGFIRTGGSHVGQLLRLADVHHHIVLTHVLAHNHAHVDAIAGLDEEGAAVLQPEHAVSNRFARV